MVLSSDQEILSSAQCSPTPVLVIFFLLISLLLFPLSPLYAADEKKKLSDIQEKLRTTKEKVKESIKKEKSVLERIDDINSSIKKKSQELADYDKRIKRSESEIEGLAGDINNLNGKLDGRKDHLKERLRALYKQQYGGHALILISAKDYQDLITKSKYISLIAHYDSKVIDRYSTDIQDILSKKSEFESLNARLKADKERAQETRKALQTDRAKKDKLLAMIRSKRQTYEKSVRELEESSKKLRQMINKMKMKTLPKSITGKGFKASRGRLPWPVNGKVVIPFGEYNDPEFNITVYKNGIEIKPDRGGQPKAIAGGRVVYADWFKGYGLLLIIDHGSGYHSLYGNLSEIFLKTGDILVGGTVVGKIGTSRLLDYPALYFEIRYKGKPTDPGEWLKRKTISSKKLRIK